MYTLRRGAGVASVDRNRHTEDVCGGIDIDDPAAVPRIARSTTDAATDVARRRIFHFASTTREPSRVVDRTRAVE